MLTRSRASWTLWQGYIQVGSSTSGWADALAGRQVLLFGDERVIGPSNWLNVGRTFDVARVDLHHPWFDVAVFGSSVVPGSNTFLHRAIPGNNFYGIYGSFKNIIPRSTFEPYVLWRLAPGNFGLPETVGRGHLNEVTIGLSPRSSTTTLSLMDRRVLLAHLPSVHGRAMPASARRFARLPQRRGSLSRATTPRERKIRRAVTGIQRTELWFWLRPPVRRTISRDHHAGTRLQLPIRLCRM